MVTSAVVSQLNLALVVLYSLYSLRRIQLHVMVYSKKMRAYSVGYL